MATSKKKAAAEAKPEPKPRAPSGTFYVPCSAACGRELIPKPNRKIKGANRWYHPECLPAGKHFEREGAIPKDETREMIAKGELVTKKGPADVPATAPKKARKSA